MQNNSIYSFTHLFIYSFCLFVVINCNAKTKLTKILIIYIKSNELLIDDG